MRKTLLLIDSCLLFSLTAKSCHLFGHFCQPQVHPFEDAAVDKTPILPFTCRVSGQHFNAFLNGSDRPDVELAAGYGIHDLLFEHQIGHIAGWDHDTLFATQSPGFANGIESLDLLIYPSDCLDLALLVHRPGYGNALLDGYIRQCR